MKNLLTDQDKEFLGFIAVMCVWFGPAIISLLFAPQSYIYTGAWIFLFLIAFPVFATIVYFTKKLYNKILGDIK